MTKSITARADRGHLGRPVPSAACRRFRLIYVEFKTPLANDLERNQQKLRKFIRGKMLVHGPLTHPNRGSPVRQGDLTGRDPKAPASRQPASTDKYVKFKNDLGLAEIGVGVKEFKCIGVSPPDDHPHIYHNMGDADFVNCLYCNTRYVYRPYLGRYETEPPGNLFEEL